VNAPLFQCIILTNPHKGLQIYDKIVMFGEVDATNHNDLRNIAHLVKNKQDVSVVQDLSRAFYTNKLPHRM
jgi:hypothetical protein